jgi:hypothetical protein
MEKTLKNKKTAAGAATFLGGHMNFSDYLSKKREEVLILMALNRFRIQKMGFSVMSVVRGTNTIQQEKWNETRMIILPSEVEDVLEELVSARILNAHQNVDSSVWYFTFSPFVEET